MLEATLRGDLAALYRAQRRKVELVPVAFRFYYLAVATSALNRPRETVDLLLAIDPTAPGLRNLSHYWVLLTGARHTLQDYEQELDDAGRGRRQWPDNLAVLECEARALAALGRIDEAFTRIREGATLPPDPTRTPGQLMESMSLELRAHGEHAASCAVLEDAAAWYAGRPSAESAGPAVRHALARIHSALGHWEEAGGLLERLAAEDPANVDYQGGMGVAAARLGREADAQRVEDLLRDMPPRHLFGAQTLWRARLAAVRGDARSALRLLREALAQGQPFGLWLHTDPDLESLCDEAAFRELLAPKG